MGTVLPERDPYVGIIDGSLAFSSDLKERREGFLMLAENSLVTFADSLNSLECEGFVKNDEKIKAKLQALYDAFMMEYKFQVNQTDDEGRFVLVPRE